MPFTTTADVRARVGRRVWDAGVKADGLVTEEDVALFITDVDGELTSCLLAAGLTIPIDTTLTGGQEFDDFLSRLSSSGVAALTLKAMFPDSRGPGETPAWSFHEKIYRDGLGLLKARKGIPPALLGGDADRLPEGYFQHYPETEPTLGTQADDYRFESDEEW